MLSATVRMQYYPGAQQNLMAYSGYGKQRNSVPTYYGALADPIPSPNFLPTPPLPSPLSLDTTRPGFFPVQQQAQPQKYSDAAVTLLAEQAPEEFAWPWEQAQESVLVGDTGYVSQGSMTPVSAPTEDYHTPIFSKSPPVQVAPFSAFSQPSLRPAYSHANAYPSTAAYGPIRYPSHPTHLQSYPYFPMQQRQEAAVPFPYNNSCHICGKTYVRQSNLKTHLRTHNNEKRYQCSTCQKSFKKAANLTAHLRTHSGEKPFKCPICNQGFSHRSSVTPHVRTHTGECPYECNKCGKSFATRFSLTTHYRIHTREKPYQCKICAERYSHSSKLNRHMRRTHRNYFVGAQVVSPGAH